MTAFQSRRRAIALSLLIALAAAIFYASPHGIAFEDRFGLNWLFALRGPLDPPSGVVVVALDDRSSRELGYPGKPDRWPRSIHGRLVDRLTGNGASAIAFDLILDKPHPFPQEDAALAAAIGRSKRVVLFAEREQEEAAGVVLYRPPLPEFTAGAAAYAPFTLPRDTNRVSQYEGFVREAYHMPTLPVATFFVHTSHLFGEWPEIGEKIGAYVLGKAAPDELGLTKAEILTDAIHAIRDAVQRDPQVATALRHLLTERAAKGGEASGLSDSTAMIDAVLDLLTGPRVRYINLYGPPGHVPTVPYDVMINGPRPGDPPPPDVGGSTVFVGYSELEEPTNVDDFYTPFDNDDGITFSGVEIAATAFANLITGRSIEPVSLAGGTAIVFVFAAGIALAAFLLPARTSIPLALAGGAAYLLGGQLLFSRHDIWLPVVTPLLVALPAGVFSGVMWQYTAERSKGREAQTRIAELQGAIRKLVPPDSAAGIIGEGVGHLSEATTRQVVCLAADAINSTQLHVGQTSAEALEFQNAFLAALSQPVRKYYPDFREFVADSALFAWTVVDTDALPRERACRSAIEALAAIDAFNRSVAPKRLGIRIGLHLGEASFGFIGDGEHLNFRAIGAAVDTTSRVEGLNKLLQTNLLATGPVVAGLNDLVLRPLGEFLLIGLSGPLPIYEIRGTQSEVGPDEMELCLRYAEAIDAFQSHAWGKAADRAKRILDDYPDDGATAFLADQCRERIANRVQGIDAAVFRITRK